MCSALTNLFAGYMQDCSVFVPVGKRISLPHQCGPGLRRNKVSSKYVIGLALAILIPAAVLAGGHSSCAKCHDADEFQAMTADEISAALQDGSISQHKNMKLTDEQAQAIAAELAGS
jgi:hypothetical protein